MPPRILSREQVLDKLVAEFRTRGYDATALSDIANATGLGKSSLYHHFPGGKEQMAADVLHHLAATLETRVFAPLRSVKPARQRLGKLLDALDGFYRGGRDACLLERLTASQQAGALRRPLRETFRGMIAAFEEVALDAGLPPATARDRAEDAVVRIEGALVVAAGLAETAPFERVIRSLRRDFLAPVSP